MSNTLQLVRALVTAGEVRVSEHGYEEIVSDGILIRDILSGVAEGIVVEDYPHYGKGPSVLVLQMDSMSRPVHVVWGIPKGHSKPAVVVTAYRPDPSRWLEGYRERLR